MSENRLSLGDVGLISYLTRPYLLELLKQSLTESDELKKSLIWEKIITNFFEMRNTTEETEKDWEFLMQEFQRRVASHCGWDGYKGESGNDIHFKENTGLKDHSKNDSNTCSQKNVITTLSRKLCLCHVNAKE